MGAIVGELEKGVVVVREPGEAVDVTVIVAMRLSGSGHVVGPG